MSGTHDGGRVVGRGGSGAAFHPLVSVVRLPDQDRASSMPHALLADGTQKHPRESAVPGLSRLRTGRGSCEVIGAGDSGMVLGGKFRAYPLLDLIPLGRGQAFEGFAVHLLYLVRIGGFQEVVVAGDGRPVGVADLLGWNTRIGVVRLCTARIGGSWPAAGRSLGGASVAGQGICFCCSAHDRALTH